MIMRLAFSVAIHAEPEAFVVDEALSVGDAYFQQKCMQKIRAFKAGVVSHDMNAVKVLCDKAILLDHGTAIEYGEPETIINAYNCHIVRRFKGDDDLKAGRSRNGYGSQQVLIESVTLEDEYQNETQILVSGKPADIVISLYNSLFGKRLQIFTDGHKALNAAILKHFAWYENMQIILDWFHLHKKFKEQLSLAMKGRVLRNTALGKIMPLLWQGLTNEAISYLYPLLK